MLQHQNFELISIFCDRLAIKKIEPEMKTDFYYHVTCQLRHDSL